LSSFPGARPVVGSTVSGGFPFRYRSQAAERWPPAATGAERAFGGQRHRRHPPKGAPPVPRRLPWVRHCDGAMAVPTGPPAEVALHLRGAGRSPTLRPGTGPDPPSVSAVGACGVGLAAAPLFELWGEFAEFLQYYYSIRLCIFCSPTGVGLGYGGAGGLRRYFLSSARFLLRARVCRPEQLTAGRGSSGRGVFRLPSGAVLPPGYPIFYFPPQCRNVATSLPGR